MRVSRLTRAESVRYALGEVFLIVVGILLALAASDWAEGRAERRAERQILGEIRAALVEDHSAVDSLAAQLRDARDRIVALQAHIGAGGGYADSLDAWFGAVYGARNFLPNRAAFESLKSQGLGLVSDPELRAAVARVYERVYQRLDVAVQAELNVVFVVLRPYFLTRFRDLRFTRSATPIDYESVVGDIEFLNLLDYRRQNLMQAVLPAFERASVEMRELIDAIDRDLDGGTP